MSSIKAPKVFVSATSGDLRSVRALVKEALLKIGCMPIEQADFPPDYRTVSDFLTHQIEACDAVVHIAGKRYGAEPNPDSLPPGTARRSYTQLEYDVAKRLKKKVFTFICGDGFQYDECDDEPEEKVLLQRAHRAALFDSNDKYEPIATGDECAERIKHLRLQLEELARQLATEQRRQRVAWTAVAAALVALLVVSIGIWIAVGGTRKDTSEILKNTNQVKNATDDLRSTGRDIKKVVTESAANVVSIDESVHSLIESGVLAEIATRADVEPLQIKQLVLQSQSAGVDLLAYAELLSDEGRHDDAEGLARFVAETALRSENGNFLAAAKAFLIAAEERGKVIPVPDNFETALAKYTVMEQIASRGQDAWRSLSSDEQVANEPLFTELSFARSFALSQMMVFGEPQNARSTLDKAIAQVDGVLARNSSDKSKLAKLQRRRALYLAHKTRWTPFAEANQLAAEAILEADRAVALANELGTISDRTFALNTRVQARMLTFDLQSETAARETLKKVREDCRAGLSLPVDETITDQRCELTAQLGRATRELADRALSSDERNQNLDAAIELFRTALSESTSLNLPYARRIAAMELLRAYCSKSSGRHDVEIEREIEAAFDAASACGFNIDEDKLVLADYAMALADVRKDYDVSGLKVVTDLLGPTVAKFPMTTSPRMCARTNMALARVWLAKSKIQRLSPQDGIPEQDASEGRRILDRMRSEFSAKSAPRVWAEANWELGRALSESNSLDQDSSITALKNALSIFTREEDPQMWAKANRQLGIELIKSRPPQWDQGREALRNAFLVHSQKSYPDLFRSNCEAIAAVCSQAAMSADDDAVKQRFRLQSINFSVAAAQSERADGTTGRYSQQFEELASELKLSLSPDEQKQIDDEIERLKSEFAQNGIDPLK